MKNNKPSINKALLCHSAALLLTVSTPTVIAQEVSNAVKKNQPESVEVIEVSGVRESLEDALNVKRSASSIVDAISASDIDALPALDLGEALQAIPGIQLNDDQEGRLNSISLRGLGGGFILTTAFGQSFATPAPAGNLNAVGSPNPFAAFEGTVFDGVTVVKTPTADLQAGGLAGIVDKKLQQALSKKDGQLKGQIGTRFEELSGIADPNFNFSAVKHLIDDKLGVAFKIAGSGQRFRRDTFIISDYVGLESINADGVRVDNGRATNLQAFRDANNIPEDAVVFVPRRANNSSEFSDGDRLSVTGNIEYRVNDNLKVGAHLLFSERDLSDGTKEATTFAPGFNRNRVDRDFFSTSVELDLETEAFAFDQDANGNTIFSAPSFSFVNGSRQNENRRTTFRELSQGVIFYGNYIAGDWTLDAKGTISQAENNFENVGISFNTTEDFRAATPTFRDSDGVRRNVPSVGTGFNGVINLADGSAGNIVISGDLDTEYVYNDLAFTATNLSASSVNSISDANQGRRLSFAVNGRVRDLNRDLNSFEFNAQRYTDFGFGDGLRFDSVKFGGRFQREELNSIDQRQGLAGVDITNISDVFLTDDTIESDGTAFFNGNIPGTFDNTSGWLTINNSLAISTLQQNIAASSLEIPTATSFSEPNPDVVRNRTGFFDTQDRNSGLPTNLSFNFGAQQDVTAAYLLTNISGELGSVFYSGNIGVRHISTDNTFNGFETQVDDRGRNGVAVPSVFEDSYSHNLISANVAFELTDDIILRSAFYQGIVRPNLLAQRPTAGVRGGSQNVRLDLPAATVRPYEADNFDLSLEWYNRDGSAISIGYFNKKISNLFDRAEGFCPAPGENDIVDRLLGPFQRIEDSANELGFACQQVIPTIDDDGNEILRDVTINQPINTDGEIAVNGWELAIQQKLDFLPYPWNGFGGVFNYTSLRNSESEGVNPLSRVSPRSYNLIGYWENKVWSFRLGYNWRADQQLQGANGFLGFGIRTREAVERLDFAGSYKITKKTQLTFRAFNLTDQIQREFQGNDSRALRRLTYSGRRYQFLVSHRF
jgi:TonB-dependent receptor